MSKENSHHIEYIESFDLREPVLTAMLGSESWQLSDSGTELELDLPLSNLSTHERDIVEFALNPYASSKIMWGGLSQEVRIKLVEAYSNLFGEEGFYTE